MRTNLLRAGLVALAWGCGGSSGEASADSASAPEFPLEMELRVLEEGVTEWAEVPLGDAPAVALRVLPPARGTSCVQLDTVEDEAGHAWVTPPSVEGDLGAFCLSCPQRASVGAGSGFYVLPSTEPAPPPAQWLRVRAALRDCETLLPIATGEEGVPSSLRLQALPLQSPPLEQQGTVRLALVLTRGSVFFDSEEARATLEQALRLVNEELSPGRLRAEVSRTLHLAEVGLEPLSFSPGEMHALKHVLALSRTYAEAREVPVIFAGCLLEEEPLFHVRYRPLGRVTHIPGGFNTAESADGIFLAGTHCASQGARFDWPATTVARLLVHELGHFLGLYHSVEQDGAQDALSDTGKDNAMHFNPLMSSSKGFSPWQFQVMRRHPMVAYADAPAQAR
jgi:hypothetical protein